MSVDLVLYRPGREIRQDELARAVEAMGPDVQWGRGSLVLWHKEVVDMSISTPWPEPVNGGTDVYDHDYVFLSTGSASFGILVWAAVQLKVLLGAECYDPQEGRPADLGEPPSLEEVRARILSQIGPDLILGVEWSAFLGSWLTLSSEDQLPFILKAVEKEAACPPLPVRDVPHSWKGTLGLQSGRDLVLYSYTDHRAKNRHLVISAALDDTAEVDELVGKLALALSTRFDRVVLYRSRGVLAAL